MAEKLFTDIINNLGKAREEGKIQGGYRFSDDGKLKIGGGYYDDDKMFEIEGDKDNIKVLFKKRFADGGRAHFNAGSDAVKMRSIQELYNTFTQAIVDAESLQKHGKSIYDITVDQRRNLKARLNKFKSFIKENKRMPTEKEARVEGRKDKAITDAVGPEGKGITEESIRKNMIKKGQVVKMVQGKVTFADPIRQKQFVEELTKRYLLAKNSTQATKANVLSNKDFYNKFFKGHYSESSVRTIIDRFKKKMDLKYNTLSTAEKDIHKLNRIADELISQGGRRFSGSKSYPVHHLFALGDEFVKARGKDLAVIDEKTNAGMSGSNKTLKSLVKERKQLIQDKIKNKITLEEFNTKNNDINKRATETITRYNNKNPQNKGLLNWRKLSMLNDNKIVIGQSEGGDYKKFSVDANNKELLEKLSKEDLRKYRAIIKKKSNIGDLTKIEGVTTANKINEPQKSKIRSMFNKFNVGNVYKSVRPSIDAFTTMFPGKADNAIAAAIDFPMMYMSGFPLPAAAGSAASMFLNKPNIGKGLNVSLELAALNDEERFMKRADDRTQKIENFLGNYIPEGIQKALKYSAPQEIKKYLAKRKKATYQNVDDYLPDEDLSGIKSIKGVQ